MPLRIPVYNRQEQLPGSTSPFIKTPTTAKAQATQGLGQELVNAGLKLKNERTSMEASEAMTVLNDRYRVFSSDEKKKTGLDAVGATERTNDFFNNTVKEIEGTLNTETARKFKESAARARQSGMDHMANHELTQHHERKKVVLKNHVASARLAFSDGDFTDQDREDQIAEGARLIDENFSGLSEKDRKLMKESQKDAIIVDWIKAKIKLDPAGMLDELKKYRKQIPADEYEDVENYLKRQIQGEVARTKFLEIKTDHGQDYQGMMDDVAKIKNDDLRVAVEKEVKSDYATTKTFKDARKKENQDVVLKDITRLWGDKKYSEARKLVTDNIGLLEPGDSVRWLNDIDKMSEAKLQGIEDKNNPYNIDDVNKKAVVTQRVNTNPNSITTDDIWRLHGKGLSTKTAKALTEQLRKNQERIDPRLETSYNMVKGWVRDKALGKTHAERAKNADELMERLEDFVDRYPAKDPVEDFLIPQKKLIKKRRFDDAFQAFRDTFITRGEYGGEKITLPVRRATKDESIEFSDDAFEREWLGADRLKDPKPQEPEFTPEPEPEEKKGLDVGKAIKGGVAGGLKSLGGLGTVFGEVIGRF
jgi:hypothetical protein